MLTPQPVSTADSGNQIAGCVLTPVTLRRQSACQSVNPAAVDVLLCPSVTLRHGVPE
jgi:hypothetical protein